MRLVLAVVVVCHLTSAAMAETLPPDVRDGVAAALFERAIRLYHEGKTADARVLFAEAAVVSPEGPYAETARTMVTRAEARLAKKKVAPPPPAPETSPIDPYADATIIEVKSAAPKAIVPVVMPALPRSPASQPATRPAQAATAPAPPARPGELVDPYADQTPLDPYEATRPAPRHLDRPIDPYGELE